MLLYNAGIAEKMNELESATKLQVGKYLRPEVIDLQAYAKKTEGQIFKFTGLTSELAEKAIMESTKSRSFSFAKEKCDDGTYNLYCYGGNNAADNEKFYKEAVQTIALGVEFYSKSWRYWNYNCGKRCEECSDSGVRHY